MNNENAMVVAPSNGHTVATELIQHYHQDLRSNPYQGGSTLNLTKEEQNILLAPVDERDVNIRPDGLIYYGHVYVRDRLNQAIGVGQWVLIENRTINEGNKYMFDGSLYIRGCFVSKAIGEMEYHQSNSMQSLASVYEGAKSDCLVRCCKDLGIGKECWQPSWSSNWVMKYGVKVWREKAKGGKGEFQWRHIDTMPFYDEGSVAQDSPNQPKYTPATKKQKAEDVKRDASQNKPEPVVKKEDETLKKLAGLSTLNDLRILWNSLGKNQSKYKNEFSARKQEIIDFIETRAREDAKVDEVFNALDQAGMDPKIIGTTEDLKPASKSKPKKETPKTEAPKVDLIHNMIQALTAETFERDYKELEKLIDGKKLPAEKRFYIELYEAKLRNLGIHHIPDILPF